MNTNRAGALTFIASLILSLGILCCGFFIGKGFYISRTNQPYITVKGLAERVVRADLGVWTITYTVVGNEINAVNTELFRQQSIVLSFVKGKGFVDNEISLDQVKLIDRYANQYQADRPPTQRYLIKGTIRIRSNKVDSVKAASQTTGELLKQGIILGDEVEEAANPTFYFTQLNAIRPTMLSEATTSAHNVAAQFARDTRSQLGNIRRAYQGIFEITSPDATGVSDNNVWQIRRNEQGSILKKIRLVSTIDYFLGS